MSLEQAPDADFMPVQELQNIILDKTNSPPLLITNNDLMPMQESQNIIIDKPSSLPLLFNQRLAHMPITEDICFV